MTAHIWSVLAMAISALLMMVHTVRAVCLTRDWEYDSNQKRCVMMSAAPMEYSAAVKACGVSGGRFITPESLEDITQLREVLGERVTWSTIWGDYLFVRHGNSYRVFDSQGNQMDIPLCKRCPSLVEQAAQLFNNVDETRACAHVTLNNSVHWSVSGCGHRRYVMCQYFIDPDLGLTTGDLAAIIVGSLIVLTFLITLIIDCSLHIKRQKTKQYLQSNLSPVSREKNKESSSLNIPFNFGSKTQLVPINLTLSHV